MKNVFLVRHGQASAGTDNYDRLSALGVKQASLLGDYWKNSGFVIEAAFSGSLERQQHTANLALSALPELPVVNTLEALNEYDHAMVDQLFGQGFESDKELTFDQYLGIIQRWRDAHDQELAENDRFQTFAQRGWGAVQHAVATTDASSIVFFTSGGVIATIMQQALGLDFEKTIQTIWHTRNASVTNLRIDKTKPTSNNTVVVDYNCVPHLQLHHDKTLVSLI